MNPLRVDIVQMFNYTCSEERSSPLLLQSIQTNPGYKLGLFVLFIRHIIFIIFSLILFVLVVILFIVIAKISKDI